MPKQNKVILRDQSLKRLRMTPMKADWDVAIIYLNGAQPVVLRPGMRFTATADGILTITTDNQNLPWEEDTAQKKADRYQLECEVHIDDIPRIEFYRKNLIEEATGNLILPP